LQFRKVTAAPAQRIGVYGVPGVGKTSLAMLAPGPVAVVDFDRSVGVLHKSGAVPESVQLVDGIATYGDLLEILRDPAWEQSGVKSLVIDTVTAMHKLVEEHVIRTIPSDRGAATSIESYGYGKGYSFVSEEYAKLLADLDRYHVQKGRNVVLVMHEIKAKRAGTENMELLEYTIALPESGTKSVRQQVIGWLDHLLFLNIEKVITDKGLVKSTGLRVIYCQEGPNFRAKSRSTQDPIIYNAGDGSAWNTILCLGGKSNG
jgi:hypothetical protein